jgi:hypothetical protein
VSLSGRYAYRNGLLTPVAGYGRGSVEAPEVPALFAYTLDVSGEALGVWTGHFAAVMGPAASPTQVLEVIDDAGVKRLRYRQNRNSRDGVRFTDIPSFQNVRVRMQAKFSHIAGTTSGIIFARGPTNNDDNNLVSIQGIAENGLGGRLNNFSTGTTLEHTHAQTTPAYTADDLVWMEIECIDGSAYWRMWLGAEADRPTNPQRNLEAGGSRTMTAPLGAGSVGVATTGSGERTITIHQFKVWELG